LKFSLVSGNCFLDDHGIAKIQGPHRTMHRPTKRAAVIRSPALKTTIQTRTAPVCDPDRRGLILRRRDNRCDDQRNDNQASKAPT
jgi:hypothetical protein